MMARPRICGSHARRIWEILGEQRVLINACSLDSDDQPVDLDITLDEPGIVAAFVEHFESHWRRMAPEHRDKRLGHQVA